MATGSTDILNQLAESGHRHPRISTPFLIWMVRWAKGYQLKPDHCQLCHSKLYVNELRAYCTFMREFTSGRGLICTVMVTLGSRYPLQCFASFSIFWRTSICQNFTPGPPLASGCLNFCFISQVGDSPKFFHQCNIFADLPKFYTANICAIQ